MPSKPPRPAGVRGMLPYRPGSIQLNFGDILERPKIPAIPKHFGHIGNKPPQPWQNWYNNDRVGCCVVAGGQHETAVFAAATKRPMPAFINTTLQNYSAMLVAAGGQPYNPSNPATDTGLDVEHAAQFRRKVGLKDDHGNFHKIDGYAVIDNVDDLEIAAYYFGTAGLGLSLPQSAGPQFMHHHVWDDLRSEPAGGHYPPCVGVNRKGELVLSTWNDVQGATKEYVDRYWSVGVAYLSREYMTARGLSPELIDWATLQEYMDTLGA